MDIDGVTSTCKMNQIVVAGGNTIESDPSVHCKMLLGDNFGAVHLLDVSRKLILDKIELERFKTRRIINISTATLEWIDTKLTYAAIVARGSPLVSIVCMKHNENKIYHLYTINTCPELENSDSLESNNGQTYLMLPQSTKISMDGEFMSIVSFNGRVRIIKMPDVLDPIQNEQAVEANKAS